MFTLPKKHNITYHQYMSWLESIGEYEFYDKEFSSKNGHWKLISVKLNEELLILFRLRFGV